MSVDVVTLALAKQYTDKSLEGAGGLKGDSAYQVAVNNGFTGTEKEWLESLKGQQGPQGEPGMTGRPGKDGNPGVHVGPSPAPEGTKVIINPDGVTIDIPTKLEELQDDENHRMVTDAEKQGWNNKLDSSGYQPDKLLGTDTSGNVVEKDAPSGGYDDRPFKMLVNYTTTKADEEVTSIVFSDTKYPGIKNCRQIIASVVLSRDLGANKQVSLTPDGNIYVASYLGLSTNLVMMFMLDAQSGMWYTDVQISASKGGNLNLRPGILSIPTSLPDYSYASKSFKPYESIRVAIRDSFFPEGTVIKIVGRLGG